MDVTVISELEHSRRDALVAYYLGQIASSQKADVRTANDLYEYLLIDNQITSLVDGSVVSTAIASVQQYINAVYNGMEPGYTDSFDGSEVQNWRNTASEYAVWAGYQMLADYPENYIDPTLRLGRTKAFDEFLNEIQQSRLSEASVNKALLNYLTKFEAVSNLDVIAGYVDCDNAGIDFMHADYYFVGKSNTAAGQYYWRKARFDIEDSTRALPATAWSEWLPIDIAPAQEVMSLRPIVRSGRLYVAWVERATEEITANDGATSTKNYDYKAHISYLGADQMWQVPKTYPLQKTSTVYSYSYFLAFNYLGVRRSELILHYALGTEAMKISSSVTLALDESMSLTVNYSGAPLDTANPRKTDIEAAQARFLTNLSYRTLQHTLVSIKLNGQRVTVTPIIKEGFTTTTKLQAGDFALTLWPSEGENIGVQGKLTAALVNAAGRYDSITVRLWDVTSQYTHIGESSKLLEETLVLNGLAQTKIAYPLRPTINLDATADEDSVHQNRYIRLQLLVGGNNEAAVDFLLTAKFLLKGPFIAPATAINKSVFLDLHQARANSAFTYIRLNTVFSSELVKRASVSSAKALDWEAQHTVEPIMQTSFPATGGILDFNGANGLYFWELFFHVAHAVAQRLHDEFDFAGAEKWLHYLFNPQVRERPTWPAINQDYWATRPLTFADLELSDSEVLAPVDPDAIAHAAPSHYRKTIFMLYVRNLMGWGDSLYRRLTRDALNEAKLHYVRALSLLGPAPDARTVGRWDNPDLAAVSSTAASAETSVLFESTLQAVENSLPPQQGQPWLSLLLNKHFRLPVNTHLLAFWTDLDLRLYNLRHNLTLDGKPLRLALYETPINPSDLLRAQKFANGATQRGVGGKVAIAPYRFNALLPRVQGAVQTLIGFGEQVLHYREMRDRAQQDELAQTHVLALADFGIAMQVEALVQAQTSKQVLLKSQALVQKRHDYYARLATEDVSRLEKDAGILQITAAALHVGSGAFAVLGGIMDTFPNVFGLISGGHLPGSIGHAASQAMVSAATSANITGNELLRADQHRRRREEWDLQRDQASSELNSIQEQLTVQELGISLAQRQVDYARQTVAQAKEMYSFLKTRTTNAGLYGWLLSQLSTFYFQAYDAVVGLCLSVERSWQFEMGDEETVFIQPNGWMDNYFGLTAGEALRLQLLRMESAYLRRHERRLELTKTISLKQVLTDDKWTELVQGLKTGGSGHFDLTAQHFDSDYPGHYLRQLVHVGVSLPLVLGAYQDVRAVLTQTASTTLLKPNIDSLKNLYDPKATAFPDTLRNVRASQSIALSTGMQDHGQFAVQPNDERYYPFEGTGAISTWQLYFPLHKAPEQAALIEQLEDIVVHVRYRAVDGGKAFGTQVNDWLDEVETNPPQAPLREVLPAAIG